jgi:YD repeat-containing protein
VESELPDRQRFTRPEFAIEFSYPAVTPQGHTLERSDEPFRDYARVHLSSPDSQELYVEAVRFHDLAPRDEYRHHRPYLEKRFGADSITPLTETTVRGRPAWAYAFRWDEAGRSVERAVLLFEIGGDTYRLIYDPRSALNAQVLATLTFAARV